MLWFQSLYFCHYENRVLDKSSGYFSDLKQNYSYFCNTTFIRNPFYISYFCTGCLQFNLNLLRRRTNCRNYTYNPWISVANGLITQPSQPRPPTTVCSENCKAERTQVPFYAKWERMGEAIKGLPVTRLSLGLAPCFAHPRVCHININQLKVNS